MAEIKAVKYPCAYTISGEKLMMMTILEITDSDGVVYCIITKMDDYNASVVKAPDGLFSNPINTKLVAQVFSKCLKVKKSEIVN